MTEADYKADFSNELLHDWEAFLNQRRSKMIHGGRNVCKIERTRWTVGQLVCNQEGHLFILREDVTNAKKTRRFRVEQIQGPHDLLIGKLSAGKFHKALTLVSIHSNQFLYSERTGYLQRSYEEGEK